VSFYRAQWDADPGRSLPALMSEGREALADMLDDAGLVAAGPVDWYRPRPDVLVATVQVEVIEDRAPGGGRPWESREAWVHDMAA